MIKFLKSIDKFGHPVTVLHKGGATHNTLVGSIFSIIVTMAVTAFAIASFAETFTRSNQDTYIK